MLMQALGWLGITVIGIAAVIAAFDMIPILGDWLGRIHIGRYLDRQVWREVIHRTGVKWLGKTPTIKVTDNTRLIVLDMLRGNYSRSAIQHWQEGALLLGLAEAQRMEPAAETAKAIQAYLDSRFDANGAWKEKPKHVDSALLAYAVMKGAEEPDRYKPAMDEIWRLIQEHLGEDGTVLYRMGMRDYRYVDTVGFICPFLTSYGLRYNKPECIQLAVKQLQEYEKHGMLEKHHLPCHAYQTKDRLPLGLYGWGRGLGWFAIGLIDTWRELPEQHEARPALTRSVTRYARAIMPFQAPRGHWNWTVTRPEARPDSSATATLGWFLLNASQIESVAKECQQAAEQAMRYLMSVTRRSGAVDFSQGDTKDIGVYSQLFNLLPFTQGFCMRMTSFKPNAKVVDPYDQNAHQFLESAV